jgi:CTP synthase
LGINPDIIVLRTSHAISQEMRQKIALFCNVRESAVIEAKDVDVIYEVALDLQKQNLDQHVCDHFGLTCAPADMAAWEALIHKIKHIEKDVEIALVGKYTQLQDAYLSVIEALKHAGYDQNANVTIKWIDAAVLADSEDVSSSLKDVHGILVPGGFGQRATAGKMKAIQYAREHQVPFLGLCYGMQLATIEFARNVCNLSEASSTEIDATTPHPIIHLLSDQEEGMDKGGTLRLGGYTCQLTPGSLAHTAYAQDVIVERHRHRYEFNNQYKERLEAHGLVFSGVFEPLNLMEIIELPSHPYFIATQFHPEFKSRPLKPHPLFKGFIKASIDHQALK